MDNNNIMMKEIKTDNGVHKYEEVELFLGRKVLNPENCRRNLLDYKKIMDKHKIHYGLMFGTLLGAIREGGFIPWDEDVDVFSIEEDRMRMLNALPDFEKQGFKVARYHKSDAGQLMISVIRDDDYIDTYFYEKKFNKRNWGDNSIHAKYLKETETIDLFGVKMNVPVNPREVLAILYGKNWMIPDKEGKPINKTLERRIKRFLSENLSSTYKFTKMILGKS